MFFITSYLFFADLVLVFSFFCSLFIDNCTFSCFLLIFKKVVETLLKMMKG